MIAPHFIISETTSLMSVVFKTALMRDRLTTRTCASSLGTAYSSVNENDSNHRDLINFRL